jgi:hypothetical protein
VVLMSFRYVYAPDERDGQCHQFDLIPTAASATFVEAYDWCYTLWDEPGTDTRWYLSRSLEMIWIRDEADAFEFRLRWC